ncbi:lactate utilization protein C [Arhodomonas aquaeolei]|uniref:LutC/YkgG family protein n=1 Tax=Arhodomonas aquaeolei TaxID=2369 RepID=UPI00216A0025|nr:lactate utilization protein C [Arhodomonas aquaeolei]MCS4505872.1 lactate utilization protein C [Arhodomonas aquaeolei]
MGAREEILETVRARLNAPADRPQARASAREYIQRHPPSPRPAAPGDAPPEHFRERALARGCTVAEVPSAAHVPGAVRAYMEEHGLARELVCWPRFAGLAWRESGIDAVARPAGGNDPLGVTGVFCAIAETGTLMLLSGAETPAATSLLPPAHVAVVPRERIVPGMEEAWALLRAETGEMPRAVNFVSGPSRTADIEMTVVRGVHGPGRVHVILVP